MPMPARPHVLLLWCEQMQGSHLTHAISAHGQCAPSRTSLMTGLYPRECSVMV